MPDVRRKILIIIRITSSYSIVFHWALLSGLYHRGAVIFYSGIGLGNFDVTTDWRILQGKFCIREILKCPFFI